MFSMHYGGAHPYAAFGTCYLCHSSSAEAYVRTQIDIYGEGELDFCINCAKELARFLDFIPAEEAEKQQADLIKKVESLEAEVETMRPKVEAFDFFLKKREEFLDRGEVEVAQAQ